MAPTAAYNANEVAAVYMSLDRGDLLSDDEGGNKLSGEESLKNGFFGLSDPMNLRGVLESFEYGVGQTNKQIYKIRILNPTTELEDTLLGFYEKLYPSNSSIFKSFRTASEQDARMTSVEGITNDKDTKYLESTPPLPIVYLRWGYGTNSDSGLSRIHKAVLNDIKYFVSDHQDRTIELLVTDQFTYTKGNPNFNKRPHIARVRVSDDVDGEMSLRKPSEIITELLAAYVSTYPECVPIVNLGDYEEQLNNLVYSYAAALAEGDVIDLKVKLAAENDATSNNTEYEMSRLTPETLSQIEALLDRPLVTTDSINRGAKGVITPQILYQAFKGVFEEIGFKWEMNSVKSPEPITGPLSPEQINSNVTPPGSPTSKTASDQVDDANTTAENVMVNIKRDLLDPQVNPQYTTLGAPAPPHTNMLSFWPMALSGNEIRPLTTAEKQVALTNATAPLWVNAGLVNFTNYEVGKYKNDNKNFKYDFPLLELTGKINVEETNVAETNYELGADPSYIKPLAVSIPVTTDASFTPGSINNVWTGPANSPLRVGQNPSNSGNSVDRSAPLLDLATGFLYPVSEWAQLPDEEFKSWASYARATQAIQGDPRFDYPFKWESANNPPLVFLEPTVATARWISKSTTNYAKTAKGRKDTFDNLISSVTGLFDSVFGTPPTPRQKFSKFLDKYSNAYATMGDDGEHRDISEYLERIIDNINRVIIGKDSKLRVQPIQVNAISEEERAYLTDKSIALAGFSWEVPWVESNSVMVLIMPGSNIKSDFSDSLIRPLLSFPQTYSPSTGNSIIWLDYGTPDSIVAKVEFTGDTKVLTNIQQSNFDVRQFADVKALFDGTNTLKEDTLTNVVSKILADQIATLKTQDAQGADLDANIEEIATLEAQRSRIINTTETSDGQIRAGTADVEVTAELLEIFPGLISSYQVLKDGTDELASVLGENSAQDMRKLASIVSDSEWLNFLFPDSTIRGRDNKLTTETITVSEGKPSIGEVTIPILRRRVNFASIRSRLNDKAREDKMTDYKQNYVRAMQEQAWALELTTLGLPELDDPASEFYSRLVFFKFYDPRLANGQLHWLSGAYRITGFKHKLNPSQGYLTQLSLFKDIPNDVQAARDTR